MARKAFREALAYNAIAKFLEGYQSEDKYQKEIAANLAKQEIDKQEKDRQYQLDLAKASQGSAVAVPDATAPGGYRAIRADGLDPAALQRLQDMGTLGKTAMPQSVAPTMLPGVPAARRQSMLPGVGGQATIQTNPMSGQQEPMIVGQPAQQPQPVQPTMPMIQPNATVSGPTKSFKVQQPKPTTLTVYASDLVTNKVVDTPFGKMPIKEAVAKANAAGMPIQNMNDKEGGSNNFNIGEDRRLTSEFANRFENQSVPFKNAVQNYYEAKKLAQMKTGVGDQSLVRKLVKITEGPGGRVSNEDVTGFFAGVNLSDRAKSAALRAFSRGESFPDEVRGEILAALEVSFENEKALQDQRASDLGTQYLQRGGNDPKKFIRNLDLPKIKRPLSRVMADFNAENAKAPGTKNMEKLQQLLAEIEEQETK